MLFPSFRLKQKKSSEELLKYVTGTISFDYFAMLAKLLQNAILLPQTTHDITVMVSCNFLFNSFKLQTETG